MSDMTPIAYVTRDALLARGLLPRGLMPCGPEALDALHALIDYAPRSPLELDPSRQQIIPYVLIREPGGQFLTMARLRAQTEQRLHDKLSLGVGGHMERVDAQEPSPILAAMWRELHEEVELRPGALGAPQLLGLLHDDATPVGQVHLGVIFLAQIARAEDLKVREVDKIEGWWSTPAWLRTQRARLESWSWLALDALSA